MPVTAEKPVTRAEFDERMALAKRYGPVAVANLAAEFRRRSGPVEMGTENAFGFSDLSKCGLETAPADEPAGVVGPDGRLSKRRGNPELDKLMQRMNAHDGPPTKEEIAEHLRLTSGPHDTRTEAIIADLMASDIPRGSEVAKRYTPTSVQIAKHDELLADSAGI